MWDEDLVIGPSELGWRLSRIVGHGVTMQGQRARFLICRSQKWGWEVPVGFN